MAKKEYVDVQITLPNETIKVLVALAKQGILGTTKEEVALHMLKQHLFTEVQALPKKVGA